MTFGDLSCLCACVPGHAPTNVTGDQLIYADDRGQLRVRPGPLRPELGPTTQMKRAPSLLLPAWEPAAPVSQAGPPQLPSSTGSTAERGSHSAQAAVRRSSGLLQRCLADVAERGAAAEQLPVLLASLDSGTLLAPFRGSRAPLQPRPAATAFLARMQSEHGLLVAGFSTAVASSPSVVAPVATAAAARAALVEAQHPGFTFDFIVHRGTVGAWQVPREPGSHCLDIEQLSSAPCCVLICREGSVDVEERPQDVVAVVSTYSPIAPGEPDSAPTGMQGTMAEVADELGDPTDFGSLDLTVSL